MTRLSVGGLRYHDLASETLSRAARKQAEEVLRLHWYGQGSWFSDE